MVNYRPDTCAYCGTETWCETRANGKPQCRGCKIVRFYRHVLYAPLGFDLIEWQETVLRKLYGTVRSEDGIRQYRSGYVSVAKKNGKSFLIGGMPVYHLTMESEFKAEAYGAASAKDQAGIVFNAAASLVKANPALKEKLKVIDSTKRIVRRDGGGFYQVLSADGDVQDGIEPSLAMLDELHRWKTAKAHTLYQVITKGIISRREPLVVEITTAGEEHESSLWWDEDQFAKKVIDGSAKADRFYPAVWSADAKRIKEDPEYWKSREARVAANPSHEDMGGFLEDHAIVEELDKALVNPAKRPEYFRYHLNIPVSSSAERAIDMYRWQDGGGGVDLREWSEHDVDLLIRKWGLMDKPCWAGVDASWTTDLTALNLLFPPFGDSDQWYTLAFFWMPKEQVRERERKDLVSYQRWIEQGFIIATPGAAVDLRSVKEKLRWAREIFEFRELAFDPWNFRTTASELIDDGFACVEIPQNYGHLSEATKKVLELYLDGKLQHGNNPVLNWNASCLCLQSDKKDNVQPTKPDRSRSRARIDGMSALVDAMNRALAAAPALTGDLAYSL